MDKKRVFIAGHRGMVGSAIVRQLENRNDIELIIRDRTELDLMSQSAVQKFFATEKIDEIYLAAAKVGGIQANNNYPAEFIYQNLMIECNIIHAAHLAGIQKLLFFGVFLYLSKIGCTTNDRGGSVNWRLGTNE